MLYIVWIEVEWDLGKKNFILLTIKTLWIIIYNMIYKIVHVSTGICLKFGLQILKKYLCKEPKSLVLNSLKIFSTIIPH